MYLLIPHAILRHTIPILLMTLICCAPKKNKNGKYKSICAKWGKVFMILVTDLQNMCPNAHSRFFTVRLDTVEEHHYKA